MICFSSNSRPINLARGKRPGESADDGSHAPADTQPAASCTHSLADAAMALLELLADGLTQVDHAGAGEPGLGHAGNALLEVLPVVRVQVAQVLGNGQSRAGDFRLGSRVRTARGEDRTQRRPSSPPPSAHRDPGDLAYPDPPGLGEQVGQVRARGRWVVATHVQQQSRLLPGADGRGRL